MLLCGAVMQMPSPMKQDYPGDFEETKEDGAEMSSTRTQQETNIGLMWAYDGSYKIGTPIRLFSQVRPQRCFTQFIGCWHARQGRLRTLASMSSYFQATGMLQSQLCRSLAGFLQGLVRSDMDPATNLLAGC